MSICNHLCLQADLSSDCPTQSVTTCVYFLYTEESRARATESLGVREPLRVGREGVESNGLWWVGLLHLVNCPTSRTSLLGEGEHLLESK